jgi:Tol biopolymer transport system component
MQFAPGTRLGPYEIVAPLGAGGMGEVYRARDTRLDRSVAIKVLPRALAADADRRSRFEREARLVATVAHPNVCALHDVGSASTAPGEDVAYLVMEHLDGETLDARIARGRIPHDEVVTAAIQIARGLDAAHRQRIVHRDLKPSNVMLTRSGVKLLDFGLAKAAEPHPDSSAATLTSMGTTTPGTVLGTIPYMAPEQVEGRATDHRADLFALGAVIYEMAAGRRAFAGDSPAAVASAILSTEPPPLPGSSALDRIVRDCLRKDPDERSQSAHDVALQLEGLRATSAPAAAAAGWWRRLPWMIAAASIALALVLLAAWSSSRQPAGAGAATARMLALTIAPPPGTRFSTFVEYSFIATSPDGTAVAYVAVPRGGSPEVWVRRLDSTEPIRVPGTEGTIATFWSPDSRSLAFFAGGKLKRVDLGGGAPVTLADVPFGVGLTGTWGSSGEILYAAVSGQTIMRVPAAGGDPQVALAPDPQRGERRVVLPSFLPDGRRYLYLAGGPPDHVGAIMLGSLDAPPVLIMRHQSMAQYVEPGFILFVQDGGIVARRFDLQTGTVSGAPISVAPRVNWLHSTGVAQFSVSPAGVLAYLSHHDEGRIAVFDRSGRELAELRPRAGYQNVRITSDGRQMLFDRLDPSVSAFDVWLQDLERGNEERITTHIGSDVGATWLPGGGYVYAASRGAAPRLYRRASASSAEVPLLETPGAMQMFPDVSSDGKHIVFAQRGARGAMQLMWMATADPRPERIHAAVDAAETGPRLSPDGTLLAYVS